MTISELAKIALEEGRVVKCRPAEWDAGSDDVKECLRRWCVELNCAEGMVLQTSLSRIAENVFSVKDLAADDWYEVTSE